MKFTLRAGLGFVALMLTSAAQAADMPVKGVRPYVSSYYNWTGFYIGLNAGYGFGSSTWDTPAVTTKPKGASFGGTAGYNWQTGALVFGVEADIAASMVKGDVICGVGGTCETKNEWLSTLRGRIGYAFDRWLPYITAGGAYGHTKATNTNLTPGFQGASATPFGWTAGVGLEYAFLGNWSAKLEYLYVDLGKFNCMACSATLANDVSLK
jgi:outer membrane immunogenic protein